MKSSLYETWLSQASEKPAPIRRPPRASAAVVPWRWSGDRLEVFWIRRSPQMRFMGGWHAFPGGGLSRSDAAIQLPGRPVGSQDQAPTAGMPSSLSGDPESLDPNLVPGIAVCALREVFEEIGILPDLSLGVDGNPTSERLRSLAEARKRLLAKDLSFANLLEQLFLSPQAERLSFAGRWLTPPLAPMRFDNRFFLLHWPQQEPLQPVIDGGELVEGEWVEPAEALAAWQRGEVITSPPIQHLLRVLAEDGPETGLPRLRIPAEANLGPFRRVEFRPGVLLLPLETPTLPPATHTNAFLLGNHSTVLIDPGSPYPAQIEALQASLDSARREHGKEIEAIWLTHHHPDHVGGVEALRRFLDVPVFAHPHAAKRLAEMGISVDGFLEDGQRVVLGEKVQGNQEPFPVRICHTPGHAQGHLCFFDETHGSLIAGDLVAGLGTIVIDPPEGDMSQYLDSLEKMIQLAPRTLFPAHGPAISQAVTKLQGYRDHRLWREKKVLDAWNGGLRTPEEIVPAVYEDLVPEVHPIAARQITAHLDRLRQLGRLEQVSSEPGNP